MSTRDLGDEREQREWQAQEAAVQAERAAAGAGSDPAIAQYRMVARALRQPPLAAMPSDFAARTAALAAREARVASEHVEVWLERGLVALLLVAGAAALLFYRDEPLIDFSLSLPERAGLGLQAVLNWSLAVAACVGLSSMLARTPKR